MFSIYNINIFHSIVSFLAFFLFRDGNGLTRHRDAATQVAEPISNDLSPLSN